MSRDQVGDPLDDLRAHLESLRDVGSAEIPDLKQKILHVLGMTPAFPDQFLYIVNYTTGKVIYAHGFERVLGYKDSTVDLPFIYGTWHPDDAPSMAKLTEAVTGAMMRMQPALKPFEVTLSVDYRIKKADGTFIKVLRHTSVFDVHQETGQVISTFSICQDITKIKKSDRIGWQIAGPRMHEVDIREFDACFTKLAYEPSPREKEVIGLLAKGLSSKRIAEQLHLSVFTVNTHRGNLLKRLCLSNTSELISKASEEDWI